MIGPSGDTIVTRITPGTDAHDRILREDFSLLLSLFSFMYFVYVSCILWKFFYLWWGDLFSYLPLVNITVVYILGFMYKLYCCTVFFDF